jgi:hypothetical protein
MERTMPEPATASDGFFFALHLMDSLGAVYDRIELLRCLKQVASGKLSVFDSPEKELQKIEKEKGRGTDEEREEFIRGFAGRRAMDSHHQMTAAAIVEEMGPEIEWPT